MFEFTVCAGVLWVLYKTPMLGYVGVILSGYACTCTRDLHEYPSHEVSSS